MIRVIIKVKNSLYNDDDDNNNYDYDYDDDDDFTAIRQVQLAFASPSNERSGVSFPKVATQWLGLDSNLLPYDCMA